MNPGPRQMMSLPPRCTAIHVLTCKRSSNKVLITFAECWQLSTALNKLSRKTDLPGHSNEQKRDSTQLVCMSVHVYVSSLITQTLRMCWPGGRIFIQVMASTLHKPSLCSRLQLLIILRPDLPFSDQAQGWISPR